MKNWHPRRTDRKAEHLKEDVSFESARSLAEYYIAYFWGAGKFYTLAFDMEMDDVIQEVLFRFIARDTVRKFDPSVTTFRYYILITVRNTLKDLLKHQKSPCVSLEEVVVPEENLRLIDLLDSSDELPTEERVISSLYVDSFLETLDRSTEGPVFDSPLCGFCRMDEYHVGLHFLNSWGQKQIADLFQVSPSRITLYKRQIAGKLSRLLSSPK